jgi:hypothetical protein
MDNKVPTMWKEAVVAVQELFQKQSEESEERHIGLSHDVGVSIEIGTGYILNKSRQTYGLVIIMLLCL